jgi:hypothetical protein
MRRFLVWLEARNRARAVRFWRTRGCVVVSVADWHTMSASASQVARLLDTSGFLRNGAEHTGKCRHAERKFRRYTEVIRDVHTVAH